LFALCRLLFAISALELSGLAFLGLIGDPDFAELGSILKQNQAYVYQAPMLVVLPGSFLSLILLSVHLTRFHR
jgi:ABC-type dipeptide/oligopeptide/nickel transport system permease subunit